MATIHCIRRGSVLPEAIQEIASENRISTALVSAIGGVDRLTIAFYNRESKKYEEHSYEEFFEVAPIIGNITVKDGKPFLHAHGSFGRKDLSLIGGHLIAARVFPVLEVVIIPTDNTAERAFDSDLGLNLIAGESDEPGIKPGRKS